MDPNRLMKIVIQNARGELEYFGGEVASISAASTGI